MSMLFASVVMSVAIAEPLPDPGPSFDPYRGLRDTSYLVPHRTHRDFARAWTAVGAVSGAALVGGLIRINFANSISQFEWDATVAALGVTTLSAVPHLAQATLSAWYLERAAGLQEPPIFTLLAVLAVPVGILTHRAMVEHPPPFADTLVVAIGSWHVLASIQQLYTIRHRRQKLGFGPQPRHARERARQPE